MGTTVLIIEDEHEMAELIKDRLEDEGYKAKIAYTGNEAIKDIKERKPDVITLDVYLPDMNGLNILKDLKSDPKTDSIPVIVVTSSDEEQGAKELGAESFVKKPVNFMKLLGVLKSVKDKINKATA